MNDFIERTTGSFAQLLERRFNKSVLTTEDSVRYTFYAALLSANPMPPEQVVMEYPHPKIPNAKVDTVLLDAALTPSVAIEFKYDREIPSGLNSPMPQKAGAVFKDLARLITLSWPVARLMVHLSNAGFSRYWNAPENGLSVIFGMKQGAALEISSSYFSGRSNTFRNSMGLWPGTAGLVCILSQSLPRGHELRIYEVEPR